MSDYPASPRVCNLSSERGLQGPRPMSPLWETAMIEQVYITQDSQRTYHAEWFQDGEYRFYDGALTVASIERKASF